MKEKAFSIWYIERLLFDVKKEVTEFNQINLFKKYDKIENISSVNSCHSKIIPFNKSTKI